MRVAIITHAFPPSRHANGKRPYYLAKGFLSAGWEVDVFTSSLGCDALFEETLNHKRCCITRVEDPVVKLLEKIKPMRLMYRLGVFLTNGLIWPDFYALWSRKVAKILSKRDEYDRVLAFVFPPSVYLCANYKGLVDRNWIFDLQESVTPQYQIVPRRSPLQKYWLPRLEKLEQKALHQAGKVVYTAETNRLTYIKEKLVSESITEHVPYFYDEEIFNQSPSSIENGFEIRYFGTFDWQGNRTPEVFLSALAQFLKEYPEARIKTRFVFYGSWHTEHDAMIKHYDLADVVVIKNPVPYEQYLELVESAPVLLLVISANHNLFMPSKIVDYFGAARPILAFVPEGSEMRMVLEEAGMAEQAVGETDVQGGFRAIESLWQCYKADDFENMEANTEFWSSSVQIPRYVKLMEDM